MNGTRCVVPGKYNSHLECLVATRKFIHTLKQKHPKAVIENEGKIGTMKVNLSYSLILYLYFLAIL